MSDHTDCDGCGQRILPHEPHWKIHHETPYQRVGDRQDYPLDACSPVCLTEVAYQIHTERTEVTE
jgi:hypothetical protein